MNPIKHLNEKRTALITEADLVIDGAAAEKRALTAAENFRLDKIKSDIFQVDSDLAREQLKLNHAARQHEQGQGNMPDLRGYSIVRAINCAGNGRLDGLELEASQEIATRSGKNPNGFFIPNAVLTEQRGMSVTGDGLAYGASMIGTETRGLLEALKPVSRVIQAGATLFSGLTSNISIPRQTAASTASWKSERAELDENSPVIDQVSLVPNRVGAFVELSNQLLIQTGQSIEAFIRNDLLASIATAIDSAAICGTGQTNQPLGILATPNIGNIIGGTDGAAPTWAHICALVGAVADANADFGSLAYLTNSKVAAKLRSTQRVAATDSRMVLEGSLLLDYPIYFSNNVPSTLTKGGASGVCSAIIFGNFADVLIGQFGMGTDVIVDRFSKATNGITRIIAQSFVDIAIRREASFAAMKDALTA